MTFFWGNLDEMAGGGAQFNSLRFSRLDSRRLIWAFVLSLAAHFLVWGGYEFGKRFGVWQKLHFPPLKVFANAKPARAVVSQSEPLVFVEVNPEQATPEAPKNTKYYSSRNSLAADRTKGNKSVPQLKGKQTEIAKTESVPRPDFSKLQPAAPPANPHHETPRPQLEPGELTLARLENSKQQQEQRERPRTLKQALARQAHRLPGPEMKEEGGARREALVPSLNVSASPFGTYDEAFIEAVTQRWYDLLDSHQFARDRSGKVILQFHLNYDGSISDIKVVQNTVGELLCYVCQKAVMDPAPYARWPSGMRELVGANYREITFTFYYY